MSPPLSPSNHHDGCKKWKRTNLRLATQNYSSNNAAAAASAVTDDSSSSTTVTNEEASSEAARSVAAADDYLHLPIILSDSLSSSLEDENNSHGDNTDEDEQQQYSTRRRRLPQLMALDRYLATSVPQLTSSTQQLLFSSHAAAANCDGSHQVITSSNSGRVINVLQGEMAHCTPSQ